MLSIMIGRLVAVVPETMSSSELRKEILLLCGFLWLDSCA